MKNAKKNNKISAFVVVKNESKNIESCLKNLSFCDEIVVIDQQSTDDTVKLAKKYTKKVFIDKAWGFCEPSRILAITKCTGNWIINLDADERISNKLRNEIFDAIKSNDADCFYMHRNLVFMGKIMKNLGSDDFILRLHKKNAVDYFDKMHSTPKPKSGSKVKYLKNSLDHANISKQRVLKKIKYFAKTQAMNDPKNKSLIRRLFGIFYIPLFYFFHLYFVRKGVFDKKEGFIYTYLAAYYQFEIQRNVWLKKIKE